MGLPLRSPVAKLSCEAATEENAKRRSFMPRTQVTGKANFSARNNIRFARHPLGIRFSSATSISDLAIYQQLT